MRIPTYILAILTIILSPLFFGRLHSTYQNLLLSGLPIATISYLVILFSKKSPRTKGIWTLIVILSAATQWITEPIFIRKSYQMYLNAHEAELISIAEILADKPQGIYEQHEHTPSEKCQISPEELDSLSPLQTLAKVKTNSVTGRWIYFVLSIFGVQVLG